VVRLGPLQTDGAGITAFVLAVLVAVGVHIGLGRTRVGMGLKVMSGNPTTARLLGIPVNRLAAITVAVGSALAGLGGVLVGTRIGAVSPDIGDLLGLKAIAVALFAGLGNVAGALVCGLSLGVAEALIQTYTNGSYQDALAFGMIIVILLVRPRGLFGVPREMAGAV
jgi:branched-chain amino acid transport system permease protein